ncbi:MAG: glutaredoxin family protein [Desulfarculus sp.]|nr:glutaredoxin family protein [Desulfarculus sp.]
MEKQTSLRAEVIIYSTPGCGRCQAAADFFRARGLAVTMLDVASDFAALRRMARLAPGVRTVPVIEHQGRARVGFEPEYWERRLGEQA